ncbi:MAG: hypothetical protein O3A50_06945 [Planctomycetota bacterium]|nr:hypothetical protein [Planctomycetota bacterium]
MYPRTRTPRQNRGLTRFEWLWTLLLFAFIIGTIVSTLDAEVERGNERMARDAISYLSSQLYLGLETQDFASPETLPLPMLGPGLPPRGLPLGGEEPARLASIMPTSGYLPVDPWGRGYVLLLGTADGMLSLFVVSSGGSGILPIDVGLTTPLAARVHFPIN